VQIIARERLAVARAAGIQPSAVDKAACLVKKEEIGRADRSVGTGDLLGCIEEDGKWKVVFLRQLTQFFRGILRIGNRIIGTDSDR